MVVPKEILVGQIEDVIAAKGGKISETALFDLGMEGEIKDGYNRCVYDRIPRERPDIGRGGRICGYGEDPESSGRDGDRTEKIETASAHGAQVKFREEQNSEDE